MIYLPLLVDVNRIDDADHGRVNRDIAVFKGHARAAAADVEHGITDARAQIVHRDEPVADRSAGHGIEHVQDEQLKADQTLILAGSYDGADYSS